VSERLQVYGTGLTLGPAGVLIRGPSGSGKSLLALALLDHWELRGLEARLVADDQVFIEPAERGLAMHAPPTIAGLIELRGRGIVRRPFVTGRTLNLVVDLVGELVRMPEDAEFRTELAGMSISRCPVPRAGVAGVAHQILLVREALEGRMADAASARQKTT
jgi:HPr kinase/phosphorylase